MFLGTHYEVTVSCAENDWIAHADEFMEEGKLVSLTVDPGCIQLGDKEE